MRKVIGFTLVLALFGGAAPATAQTGGTRIMDLALHEGDVPVRLVGYGLVVGLNGTGDRSFGGSLSHNATVRSVVNMLRRFDVEVPPEYLRLRNVAAVMVTAEVSPYLRAGGRFDVQVSALADASSLEGGALWITPLVGDPGRPALGTAQGSVLLRGESMSRVSYARPVNSGRIPDGGVLEAPLDSLVATGARLILRRPDRVTARRIADAVTAAFGDGAAVVEDPGSVRLTPPADGGDTFLSDVDLLTVEVEPAARVIINGTTGTVVAGGELRVRSASVHHQGITLRVGPEAASGAAPASGLVEFPPGPLVQDVVAGLHAAGARPGEVAAILEALRDAGALTAEVVVR